MLHICINYTRTHTRVIKDTTQFATEYWIPDELTTLCAETQCTERCMLPLLSTVCATVCRNLSECVRIACCSRTIVHKFIFHSCVLSMHRTYCTCDKRYAMITVLQCRWNNEHNPVPVRARWIQNFAIESCTFSNQFISSNCHDVMTLLVVYTLYDVIALTLKFWAVWIVRQFSLSNTTIFLTRVEVYLSWIIISNIITHRTQRLFKYLLSVFQLPFLRWCPLWCINLWSRRLSFAFSYSNFSYSHCIFFSPNDTLNFQGQEISK